MQRFQGREIYSQITRENQVASANRHQLIDLLLTGAKDNLNQAVIDIQDNHVQEKCQHLSKAFNIIDGLRLSLDFEKGGEIADNLDQLYEYMQNLIIESNLKNIKAPLEEVDNLLTTLQSGWQNIENR